MPLTTDSLICLGVVFILESDRFKAPVHGKSAPHINDRHLGGADYKYKALYKNANIKAYIFKGQMQRQNKDLSSAMHSARTP